VRLLLDTRVFLWLVYSPDRLSPASRALCEETDTTLLLSVASVWEMAIKIGGGKLELRHGLEELVGRQVRVNRVVVLPITLPHALRMQALPTLHKDPFDRMLIAQSIFESAPIVTSDAAVLRYGMAAVRTDR